MSCRGGWQPDTSSIISVRSSKLSAASRVATRAMVCCIWVQSLVKRIMNCMDLSISDVSSNSSKNSTCNFVPTTCALTNTSAASYDLWMVSSHTNNSDSFCTQLDFTPAHNHRDLRERKRLFSVPLQCQERYSLRILSI